MTSRISPRERMTAKQNAVIINVTVNKVTTTASRSIGKIIKPNGRREFGELEKLTQEERLRTNKVMTEEIEETSMTEIALPARRDEVPMGVNAIFERKPRWRSAAKVSAARE